jgi:hypothetical protein
MSRQAVKCNPHKFAASSLEMSAIGTPALRACQTAMNEKSSAKSSTLVFT